MYSRESGSPHYINIYWRDNAIVSFQTLIQTNVKIDALTTPKVEIKAFSNDGRDDGLRQVVRFPE